VRARAGRRKRKIIGCGVRANLIIIDWRERRVEKFSNDPPFNESRRRRRAGDERNSGARCWRPNRPSRVLARYRKDLPSPFLLRSCALVAKDDRKSIETIARGDTRAATRANDARWQKSSGRKSDREATGSFLGAERKETLRRRVKARKAESLIRAKNNQLPRLRSFAPFFSLRSRGK